MQISNRLAAVAAMVSPGSRIADIGTDHAYIPIYLVKNGIVPGAIAMDVNRGPLQKAEENIRFNHLEDCIETRLSDGLEALLPGEAESIIVAGMGGPLTVRILRDAAAKLQGCRELILQPQSDIGQVRTYIQQNAWKIAGETIILEEGKYYPMMRVIPADEHKTGEVMSESEIRFGPLLLRQRHPVLEAYIQKELAVCHRILQKLEGQTSESARQRREEMTKESEFLTRTFMRHFGEKEGE